MLVLSYIHARLLDLYQDDDYLQFRDMCVDARYARYCYKVHPKSCCRIFCLKPFHLVPRLHALRNDAHSLGYGVRYLPTMVV